MKSDYSTRKNKQGAGSKVEILFKNKYMSLQKVIKRYYPEMLVQGERPEVTAEKIIVNMQQYRMVTDAELFSYGVKFAKNALTYCYPNSTGVPPEIRMLFNEHCQEVLNPGVKESIIEKVVNKITKKVSKDKVTLHYSTFDLRTNFETEFDSFDEMYYGIPTLNDKKVYLLSLEYREDDHSDDEVIVTDSKLSVMNQLEYLHRINCGKSVEAVFVFEYSSYEEAYKSALAMKENSELCYEK